MFFICDTGETTDGNGCQYSNLYIWRDDNFIFFGCKSGMHSVQMEDDELEYFCKFLKEASYNKDYVEFKPREKSQLYIGIEPDDEGSRNLCIIDNRTYLIFNLKTDILHNMSRFLNKQIKKTEENKQCTLF